MVQLKANVWKIPAFLSRNQETPSSKCEANPSFVVNSMEFHASHPQYITEASSLSIPPTPQLAATHLSTLLKNTSSSISTTPFYISPYSLTGNIKAIVPMTSYLFISPLASLELLLSSNQTRGHGEATRAVPIEACNLAVEAWMQESCMDNQSRNQATNANAARK